MGAARGNDFACAPLAAGGVAHSTTACPQGLCWMGPARTTRSTRTQAPQTATCAAFSGNVKHRSPTNVPVFCRRAGIPQRDALRYGDWHGTFGLDIRADTAEPDSSSSTWPLYHHGAAPARERSHSARDRLLRAQMTVMTMCIVITVHRSPYIVVHVNFGATQCTMYIHCVDAAGAAPWKGTVLPGELLYIPPGCPHTLINRPGAPTLSISQNYVDERNLERARLEARCDKPPPNPVHPPVPRFCGQGGC